MEFQKCPQRQEKSLCTFLLLSRIADNPSVMVLAGLELTFSTVFSMRLCFEFVLEQY